MRNVDKARASQPDIVSRSQTRLISQALCRDSNDRVSNVLTEVSKRLKRLAFCRFVPSLSR